jgi:hypothetical protein
MNRYILIRRLRAPAFLLLVGVIALLDEANVLSWGQCWPLFLILAGVLLLAERAALAGESYPPPPGSPWPSTTPGTFQSAGQAAQPTPGTATVPQETHDYGDEIHGGQS